MSSISVIEHKNIYEAIFGVMQDVGYVKKTDSQKLGYSYASESELIAALRPAMIEHGIIIFVLSQVPSKEVFVTSNDKNMNVTATTATIRFYHVPSGTFQDVVALGEGMDTGDKSANKAMTGALKYALRQTFMIETGDDPDKDSSKSMERKARKSEEEQLLSDAVQSIVVECAEKGGQDNAALLSILDAKLGGHALKNFKAIKNLSEAKELLAEIKKVEPIKKEENK